MRHRCRNLLLLVLATGAVPVALLAEPAPLATRLVSQTPECTVCVLEFVARSEKDGQDWIPIALQDQVIRDVFCLGRYHVLDRRNLRSILQEQSLQASGLVAPEGAVRFGRIAKVDYVLLGDFVATADGIDMSLSVIRVNDGRVVAHSATNGVVRELSVLAGKLTHGICTRGWADFTAEETERILRRPRPPFDRVVAYAKAIRNYEDGDFGTSTRYLYELLQGTPDCPEAQALLGEIQLLSREFDHSAVSLEAALRSCSSNDLTRVAAIENLSTLYDRELGITDRGAAAFATLAEIAPGMREKAFRRSAELYEESGDVLASYRMYQNACDYNAVRLYARIIEEHGRVVEVPRNTDRFGFSLLDPANPGTLMYEKKAIPYVCVAVAGYAVTNIHVEGEPVRENVLNMASPWTTNMEISFSCSAFCYPEAKEIFRSFNAREGETFRVDVPPDKPTRVLHLAFSNSRYHTWGGRVTFQLGPVKDADRAVPTDRKRFRTTRDKPKGGDSEIVLPGKKTCAYPTLLVHPSTGFWFALCSSQTGAGTEIWTARSGDGFRWQDPEPFPWNTGNQEGYPCLTAHEEDTFLYWTRRRLSLPGYAIHRSRCDASGVWGPPQKCVFEGNGTNTVLYDSRVLFDDDGMWRMVVKSTVTDVRVRYDDAGVCTVASGRGSGYRICTATSKDGVNWSAPAAISQNVFPEGTRVQLGSHMPDTITLSKRNGWYLVVEVGGKRLFVSRDMCAWRELISPARDCLPVFVNDNSYEVVAIQQSTESMSWFRSTDLQKWENTPWKKVRYPQWTWASDRTIVSDVRIPLVCNVTPAKNESSSAVNREVIGIYRIDKEFCVVKGPSTAGSPRVAGVTNSVLSGAGGDGGGGKQTTLIVLPLVNAAAPSVLPDGFAVGAADLLEVVLSHDPTLKVLIRRELVEVQKELTLPFSDKGVKLGKLIGATHVISGTYLKRGEEIELSLLLTEVETGKIAGTTRIAGKTDDLYSLCVRISHDVVTAGFRQTVQGLAIDRFPLANQYYMRGLAYMSCGYPERAIPMFVTSMRQPGASPDARLQLAKCYQVIGQWAHSYLELAKLSRDAPEASDRMGVAALVGSCAQHLTDTERKLISDLAVSLK